MSEYSKFVEFSTHFFQIRAWVISARREKQLDVTTMFTDFHAKNTPLGQSERAYYPSFFFFFFFKQNSLYLFWIELIPVLTPNEILVLVGNFILVSCKLKRSFVPYRVVWGRLAHAYLTWGPFLEISV